MNAVLKLESAMPANYCSAVVRGFIGKWTIVYLLVALLALTEGCSDAGYRAVVGGKEYPNLYLYKIRSSEVYLQKLSIPIDVPTRVERDSRGTALYIHDYYGDNIGKYIYTISAGGEVRRIESPARVSFLNDKEQFVAWYDDFVQGVHFNTGLLLKYPEHARFISDPSGSYFILVSADETKLYSFTDPEVILLDLSNYYGERLFVRNGKMYIFGFDPTSYRRTGLQGEIIALICHYDGTRFTADERISIQRPTPYSSPFVVADMDPWSDNVLIEDVVDAPFSFLSSWYVYHLTKRKMEKVGEGYSYGFFLKDDILSRAINN